MKNSNVRMICEAAVMMAMAQILSYITVSYTHLDVYKRQAP